MKRVRLAQTAEASPLPIIIIRPLRGWIPINLRELWAHRELLYLLAWREIKARYKQTTLGFGWAVLPPFATMVVFSLFFGMLLKVPSEGIPYPLFSYAAMLPWTLFAQGVSRSAGSVVGNISLVQKVYCPRLILPLSAILTPVVDFAVGFAILIGMTFYFGYPITLRILWLPAFIILTLLTALAVGLWLSAANVKYRDVGYAVPFLVQLWLYVSPVIYPSSLIPQPFRIVYGFNPMAGVIEGFRWVLLGTTAPSSVLMVSVISVIILLVAGAYYFRRMEKTFADLV